VSGPTPEEIEAARKEMEKEIERMERERDGK
jgi:hypothetical protein